MGSNDGSSSSSPQSARPQGRASVNVSPQGSPRLGSGAADGNLRSKEPTSPRERKAPNGSGAADPSSSEASPRERAKETVPRSKSSPAWVDSQHAAAAPSLSVFFQDQLGWDCEPRPPEHLNGVDLQRRREGIYNFFYVPRNLERLLLFGYLACFDSFVQQFTFLPIRVVSALTTLLCWHRPTPAQKRDLLRGTLIFLVSFLLLRINMSQTYHNVRNQSTIKLYVVFNILEILDKLCASFGEDILESLYNSSASGRKKRSRGGFLLDFVIALVYITLHTLVLFYQAVAFNVAVNSSSNMLLTLLVSNNFTELKANVFKRCESENLFQICCADAIERFQLGIYLLLVLTQKLVQTREWTRDTVLEFGFALLSVLVCEMVIDWVKHAFVTKFNRIRPDVYAKFGHILADMTLQLQKPGAAMGREALYAVTSRMGFVPIPLFVLVIRVVAQDVRPALELRHPSGWLLCVLVWLVFCALKVLVSILLLGMASSRAEEARASAEGQGGRDMKLEGVGRYTLHGKSVI
uniref:Uncharacterized protein n=1 Tax=Calcidiscus leptoporus TaxID=127549 RepID=A0A7S0J7C5_9EUKA|mmetsp:Transcript_41452/g.96941  ORF Transcript_41452/g.96941 Transcript_41452/m.96941 type:complete len:522 (+) Transcript_41452:182-1747(+)